ncbi:hypothetical protein H9P43_005255 [Blastocladiella emersonii ATCC 22665]|nr:hypothetical protein H9P43_005238 [Blastocladiella emersonii ATCC 22665]KAI9179923.1 hypothetical protein H9P43_005255 [Blastocladiella emersonii ATCC 22665]
MATSTIFNTTQEFILASTPTVEATTYSVIAAYSPPTTSGRTGYTYTLDGQPLAVFPATRCSRHKHHSAPRDGHGLAHKVAAAPAKVARRCSTGAKSLKRRIGGMWPEATLTDKDKEQSNQFALYLSDTQKYRAEMMQLMMDLQFEEQQARKEKKERKQAGFAAKTKRWVAGLGHRRSPEDAAVSPSDIAAKGESGSDTTLVNAGVASESCKISSHISASWKSLTSRMTCRKASNL